jgi:hypothetical protein
MGGGLLIGNTLGEMGEAMGVIEYSGGEANLGSKGFIDMGEFSIEGLKPCGKPM